MRHCLDLVEAAMAGRSPASFILELPAPAREHALAAFQSLADGQRHGAPEKLGGASLYNRGLQCSGLYAGLTEHVGDITNRMAKHFDFYQGSFDNVSEKVALGLRRVRDDIFGQVKRNFEFAADPERDSEAERAAYQDEHSRQYKGSYADWRKWWSDAGERYGAAHAKLTVWNEAQWHAREAAVAVGYLKFGLAESHLKALAAQLQSRPQWTRYAGQVVMDANGFPVAWRR